MGDALPSQQNALRMLNTASPVVMDMPETVAMRRGSGQQLREKAFWPNIEVTGMDCHSRVILARIAESILFTSWPRKSTG